MLSDGINEKGVVINTNVVPIDKGITQRFMGEKAYTVSIDLFPQM